MGGFYIGFPLSTDVGSVSVDQIRSKRGCLSYIVYDRQSKEAAIIDPSLEVGAARYCRFLSDLEVKLHYIIDTHTHADHISATREIRDACGGKL